MFFCFVLFQLVLRSYFLKDVAMIINNNIKQKNIIINKYVISCGGWGGGGVGGGGVQ